MQNNGWGISACLWVHVALCLFLCGELGTSVSVSVSLSLIMKGLQQAAYTNSSLLYSPDFYRCSLKNCIRDFMIFRAVRVLLSSHL